MNRNHVFLNTKYFRPQLLLVPQNVSLGFVRLWHILKECGGGVGWEVMQELMNQSKRQKKNVEIITFLWRIRRKHSLVSTFLNKRICQVCYECIFSCSWLHTPLNFFFFFTFEHIWASFVVNAYLWGECQNIPMKKSTLMPWTSFFFFIHSLFTLLWLSSQQQTLPNIVKLN